MNYDLNKSQIILKDEARRFLSKECPSELVREMAADETGYSQELWLKMAQLGWTGILIPEPFDGMGGNFLDLTVLLSEMGYSCLTGPFFPTVVLGGLTLLEAGSDRQNSELLPALSRGERIFSLAWVEQDGIYLPEGIRLAAESKGDDYLLNGTKLFVPYAHAADTLICVARTRKEPETSDNGLTLFIVDAGQTGIHVETLDTLADDKQCAVTFENVAVAKENILGQPDRGWPLLQAVLQKAAVAKCAEMMGGAQRAMDITIPYVKGRKQFGRPVAAFQAVQHHCANMLTYADTIKFMMYQAAWRISEGLPYAKEASMCKAWCSDGYRRLLALAHQSIGGMSFMEEYDLQLYFKHAKAAEQTLGDADFHREWVAREIGL